MVRGKVAFLCFPWNLQHFRERDKVAETFQQCTFSLDKVLLLGFWSGCLLRKPPLAALLDAPKFQAMLKTNPESQRYSETALGCLRVRFGDRLGKPMSLLFEPFLKRQSAEPTVLGDSPSLSYNVMTHEHHELS